MKKIILLGIALALLALACGEEGVTEPTYDDSPGDVLKTLESSFNQRNITSLRSCLSEDFTFYFDPDDIGQRPPGGGGYVIPESWTYNEFVRAIAKIVRTAYSVSFHMPAINVGEPRPSQTTYKVEKVNIRFLLMIDEVNGYLVDTGYCDFEFVRYGGEAGVRVWRLKKWWDNTSFPYDVKASLAPSSLGRIFAMYI